MCFRVGARSLIVETVRSTLCCGWSCGWRKKRTSTGSGFTSLTATIAWFVLWSVSAAASLQPVAWFLMQRVRVPEHLFFTRESNSRTTPPEVHNSFFFRFPDSRIGIVNHIVVTCPHLSTTKWDCNGDVSGSGVMLHLFLSPFPCRSVSLALSHSACVSGLFFVLICIFF